MNIWYIFIFTLVFSSYVLLLFLLSLIPSINLCSVAFSSISNNFECGFYSIIIPSLRYRFNYWLILFHFLIFEQELILALLLVYGIQTLNSNWIIIILYLISVLDYLFFSLLLDYFFSVLVLVDLLVQLLISLYYVLSLGAIFTTLYTLKIYMYCWWIFWFNSMFISIILIFY